MIADQSEPSDIAHDRRLIGAANGRAQIATPALILDLDVMEQNIDAMAAHAAACGIGLRPHAKTHKSAQVGQRQLARGAYGLCTARLGEAEALARAGIDDLLITAPVVDHGSIGRVIDLRRRVPKLKIVIDHKTGAERLNHAAAAAGLMLDVLIDVDMGLHRTGIPADDRAIDLATSIASAPALHLIGLQAYGGHLMHIRDAAMRQAQAQAAIAPVAALVAHLRVRGHDLRVITGGGTGTFDLDPALGLFTELQVGSYVFMDVDYLDVGRAQPWPFKPALFVQSRVISTHASGFVTIDAGLKAFATDGPKPLVAHGAAPGSRYMFMGDEQGAIIPPEGVDLPSLGDVINLIVPHCDPTVNLYDFYHVVRDQTLVDLWRIDGRGRGR